MSGTPLTQIRALELRCGRQVRAARALLEWEQADLARAAGVSLPTIHRMEKLGPQRCTLPNLLKVQQALMEVGIEFIGDDEGLGVLVRRKPVSH